MNLVIYKNTNAPTGNRVTAFKIERLINLEIDEEDMMHQYPGLVPNRIYQGEAECSDTQRGLYMALKT